jgi:hypothetical protein
VQQKLKRHNVAVNKTAKGRRELKGLKIISGSFMPSILALAARKT